MKSGSNARLHSHGETNGGGRSLAEFPPWLGSAKVSGSFIVREKDASDALAEGSTAPSLQPEA
jgi:hypothetical protein